MLKSIRIFLSIAAHIDYGTWQMDIKTVFLNGHPEEDIYIMQLYDFIAKDREQRVCKLQINLWTKAGVSQLEHPF